jgi:glycyl-tRNA synthetase alpha chain
MCRTSTTCSISISTGRGKDKVTYGEVFLGPAEYSVTTSSTPTRNSLQHFRAPDRVQGPAGVGDKGARRLLALPAHDQAIKASHIFNLLDALASPVTERQAYILRVRDLAKAACAAWLRPGWRRHG